MASEKGARYAMTMEIGATDISEMSETYLGRFIDVSMLIMLVLMFNKRLCRLVPVPPLKLPKGTHHRSKFR